MERETAKTTAAHFIGDFTPDVPSEDRYVLSYSLEF